MNYAAIFVVAMAIGTHMAWSASQEYCRPYATNMTEKTIKRIWTTFYATCLNQDEDPAVSENWPAIADIINQKGIGVVPASEKLPEPKPRPVPTPEEPVLAPEVCGRPASGFTMGSPEQTRWCKTYFKSFKPKNGTVVCKRSRKREPCA